MENIEKALERMSMLWANYDDWLIRTGVILISQNQLKLGQHDRLLRPGISPSYRRKKSRMARSASKNSTWAIPSLAVNFSGQGGGVGRFQGDQNLPIPARKA